MVSNKSKPTLLDHAIHIGKKLPGGATIHKLWWTSTKSGGRRFQWQRKVLNEESLRIIQSLNTKELDVFEISGDSWQDRIQTKSYLSKMYPEFDICTDKLDQQFDLIICEQVFEHLLWPYRAGRNVYSMLKPGGRFFVSTPFLIPIHEEPTDCSRWTATGLKYLLAECGFELEDIETHSWGNRGCVEANLKRWQIYQSWRHSLDNEKRFPVQVWGLAVKK